MFEFGFGSMARISAGFGRLLLMALVGLGGVFIFGAGSASAQDRRQNTPGEFDFYVLSLSWSPSFCEEASERGNSGRSKASAAVGRFPSWCTACGRNMSTAFPNIATGIPGWTAISCGRCWI